MKRLFKWILKACSIVIGTVLVLKGIHLLVDWLYRHCCNSYIEAGTDEPF